MGRGGERRGSRFEEWGKFLWKRREQGERRDGTRAGRGKWQVRFTRGSTGSRLKPGDAAGRGEQVGQ